MENRRDIRDRLRDVAVAVAVAIGTGVAGLGIPDAHAGGEIRDHDPDHFDYIREAPPDDCRTAEDCPGDQVCSYGLCVLDPEADDEPADDPPPETRRPDLADPLPDDGGADQACGADRRCRIQRIKARNRMRRHYNAARDEEVAHRQARQVFAEHEEDLLRRAEPWSVALQYHPLGWGIFGGRMVHDHFRAEATLVTHEERPRINPDSQDIGRISDQHDVTFGTLHATFVPSRAWFSPFVSAGFGMGRGDYGFGDAPSVVYHYVTAAAGAEAQLEAGLLVRMGIRYGRLLYNQVRHAPGNYDDETRIGLREWMHDDKLRGIDFSIGWAF